MPMNVPTIDTGTARIGMMRRAQLCRNTNTTITHQHHRLEERVDHLLDRVQREHGGVQRDVVVEPWRELLLQLLAARLRTAFARATALAPGCW